MIIFHHFWIFSEIFLVLLPLWYVFIRKYLRVRLEAMSRIYLEKPDTFSFKKALQRKIDTLLSAWVRYIDQQYYCVRLLSHYVIVHNLSRDSKSSCAPAYWINWQNSPIENQFFKIVRRKSILIKKFRQTRTDAWTYCL